MARTLTQVSLLGALALWAGGCSIKEAEAPPASAPSELATSVTLFANPDTLPQDGASQSTVVIQARDANGQPIRSYQLRVDMAVDGQTQDFGTLSARTLATGSDGRASILYTAPRSLDGIDRQTLVSIVVTPIGSDARSQMPRTVDIRLVPPGVIQPPGTAVPDFVMTPSPAQQLSDVTFDASSPTLDARITTYDWDFGDGTRGSGRTTSHRYTGAGTYSVTLTVTDYTGARSSRAKSLTVVSSPRPTASFVFSPQNPGVGEEIVFNGSASTATPPRRLVGYDWDFGTGRTGSGMVVFKRYDTPATYVVTLMVTDDAGNTASSSQSVTVGTTSPGGLQAAFSYSPASPAAGQPIVFNASASTSADPIIEYEWAWGDPNQPSPQQTTSNIVTHTFAAPGTYRVTLKIKDSRGREAQVTQQITVS